MKQLLLGMLFLSLTACTTKPRTNFEWKQYSYSDAGFAISSPVTPRILNPTSALTHYVIDLPNEQSFTVALTQLDKPISPQEAKSVLEKVASNIANGVHGEIVSSKETSLGTIPGRALSVKNGELEVAIRCYASGRNLYALVSRGSPISEDTERFFNSFKVL